MQCQQKFQLINPHLTPCLLPPYCLDLSHWHGGLRSKALWLVPGLFRLLPGADVPRKALQNECDHVRWSLTSQHDELNRRGPLSSPSFTESCVQTDRQRRAWAQALGFPAAQFVFSGFSISTLATPNSTFYLHQGSLWAKERASVFPPR